jgi:hypothetical protein
MSLQQQNETFKTELEALHHMVAIQTAQLASFANRLDSAQGKPLRGD